MNDKNEKLKLNLLGYGIEKKILRLPQEELDKRNWTLTFEPFETGRRFNEFDGVILFQGIFESFTWKPSGYSETYLSHSCDRDELDKRKKELDVLLDNGGFVCFLLCDPFRDRDGGRSFEATDLTKASLNFTSFYRKNFESRITNLQIIRDEFLEFFRIYGAATSYFDNFNDRIDLRVLAKVGYKTVSMILFDRMFFIPCLLPENDRVEEFFTLLSEALVSVRRKLHLEVPEWAKEFKFADEPRLQDEREKLKAQIESINAQLAELEKYKRVLLFDGDLLVDSVVSIFEEGFKLAVDSSDEYREDLKVILNEKPIIFAEVKGTNASVKREHINQADSHRERAGLPSDFPTILIINPHIKNSRNISEKDQELPKEQIKHAAKVNVLIIRTIDLLRLLKLYMSNEITKEKVLEFLTDKSGWLKVDDEGVHIIGE